MSYKHAGGGMLSTPEDLVRFAQAVLAGKLLGKDSTTTMFQKKYSHLEGSGNTAFAWRVDEQDGQPVIHMGGSIVGFKSFLVSWPAEELSIAVMVNQSDFARREEIAFHLAGLYLEDNKPHPQISRGPRNSINQFPISSAFGRTYRNADQLEQALRPAQARPAALYWSFIGNPS